MKNQALPESKKGKFRITLANQILIGMVLGILFGYFFPSQGVAFKPLGDAFLRMIKMIIVPLVFAGLVMGIAGTGDFKKMGRLGLKSIIWFELATTIALFYGMVLANVIQPGAGVPIVQTGDVGGIADYTTKHIDLLQTFMQIIPTNIVEGLATGNLLQIVFFSCFFGVALAAIGEKGKIIVDIASSVMEAMFKVTNYVMKLTPIGVFAFMAFTIGKYGVAMLIPMAKLLLTLYAGLILFIITVLIIACYIIKVKFFEVLRVVKQPMLLAFTTASSEAAMPLIMEKLEKFGVPKHVINFVIPTGYTFNLDGASIYFCMALLFIAQVYGIHLDIPTQLMMLLTMMAMSKGVAGVAGASIVVLAGGITTFGLPMEGLFLLMAVDRFGDMGRTATNLMGNVIATLVVARWENELPDEVIQLGYAKNYDE